MQSIKLHACRRGACAGLALLLIFLCVTLSACRSNTQQMSWQEAYDLGEKYLSEGSYKEAVLAFSAAIHLDPKAPAGYVGRGDAYAGLAEADSGQAQTYLEHAASDYEQAIALDGSDAEVYLKLADVYTSQGRTQDAAALRQQGYEATGDERLSGESGGTQDGGQQAGDTSDTGDTSETTETAETAGNVLSEYLKNTLVPEFGVCMTGNQLTSQTGILSTWTADFNADGSDELLIVHILHNCAYADLYGAENGQVSFLKNLFAQDLDCGDTGNAANVSFYIAENGGTAYLACSFLRFTFGYDHRGENLTIVDAAQDAPALQASWFRAPGGVSASISENGNQTFARDISEDSQEPAMLDEISGQMSGLLSGWGFTCSNNNNSTDNIDELEFTADSAAALCEYMFFYDDASAEAEDDQSAWRTPIPGAQTTLERLPDGGCELRLFAATSSYAAGATTVTAGLLKPCVFDEDYVSSLQIGDRVWFETSYQTVETLKWTTEQMTWGEAKALDINDYGVFFYQDQDGSYRLCVPDEYVAKYIPAVIQLNVPDGTEIRDYSASTTKYLSPGSLQELIDECSLYGDINVKVTVQDGQIVYIEKYFRP